MQEEIEQPEQVRTRGEQYFHIDSTMELVSTWDTGKPLDTTHWYSGNYFNEFDVGLRVLDDIKEILDGVPRERSS